MKTPLMDVDELLNSPERMGNLPVKSAPLEGLHMGAAV